VTTTTEPVEPTTSTTTEPVVTTTTTTEPAGPEGPATAEVTATATATAGTRSVTPAAGAKTTAAERLAYTGSAVWHPLSIGGALLFAGSLLLLGRRHLTVERRH
jgi:hypothetical protein